MVNDGVVLVDVYEVFGVGVWDRMMLVNAQRHQCSIMNPEQ